MPRLRAAPRRRRRGSGGAGGPADVAGGRFVLAKKTRPTLTAMSPAAPAGASPGRVGRGIAAGTPGRCRFAGVRWGRGAAARVDGAKGRGEGPLSGGASVRRRQGASVPCGRASAGGAVTAARSRCLSEPVVRRSYLQAVRRARARPNSATIRVTPPRSAASESLGADSQLGTRRAAEAAGGVVRRPGSAAACRARARERPPARPAYAAGEPPLCGNPDRECAQAARTAPPAVLEPSSQWVPLGSQRGLSAAAGAAKNPGIGQCF